MTLQPLVHYLLHLGFPLLLAYLLDRKQWKRGYLILLATMLVDLDHLLADPIFAPNRCSIGFHPLHTLWAVGVYCMMLVFRAPIRWIGIGLLLHMLTDLIDCLFMYAQCPTCQVGAPAYELVRRIATGVGLGG